MTSVNTSAASAALWLCSESEDDEIIDHRLFLSAARKKYDRDHVIVGLKRDYLGLLLYLTAKNLIPCLGIREVVSSASLKTLGTTTFIFTQESQIDWEMSVLLWKQDYSWL
jgi:hypothetical protein